MISVNAPMLLLTWIQLSFLSLLVTLFAAGFVAVLYRWFAESKRTEIADVDFHDRKLTEIAA